MTDIPQNDQSPLIADLESLLAMCTMRRKQKGERAFLCWLISAGVLLVTGLAIVAFVPSWGLILALLGLLAGSISMSMYPPAPTLTKEECARVFSRFDALPAKEELLERYAQWGTLHCFEVAQQLRKALYELRAEARKAEILALAKTVTEIPKVKPEAM